MKHSIAAVVLLLAIWLCPGTPASPLPVGARDPGPADLAALLCADDEAWFRWQVLEKQGVEYRVYLYTTDTGTVDPDTAGTQHSGSFLMFTGYVEAAGTSEPRFVLGTGSGIYTVDPVTGYAVVRVLPGDTGETGQLVEGEDWETAREVMIAAETTALIRELWSGDSFWQLIDREREPYTWAANGEDSLTPEVYNALCEAFGHDIELPPTAREVYREALAEALNNLTTPGASVSIEDDWGTIQTILGTVEAVSSPALDGVIESLEVGSDISKTGLTALQTVSDALGAAAIALDILGSALSITQECFETSYLLAWQGAVAETYKTELQRLTNLDYIPPGYTLLRQAIASMIDSNLNSAWVEEQIKNIICEGTFMTGAAIVTGLATDLIMSATASNPITIAIVAGIHAGLALAELTGYDRVFAGCHVAINLADFERATYHASADLAREIYNSAVVSTGVDLDTVRLFRFARKLQVSAAHRFYSECVTAGRLVDQSTSDELQDLLDAGGIADSVVQWTETRDRYAALCTAPLPIEYAEALKLNWSTEIFENRHRTLAQLAATDRTFTSGQELTYESDLTVYGDWTLDGACLEFTPPPGVRDCVLTLTVAPSGVLELTNGAEVRFAAGNTTGGSLRIVVEGSLLVDDVLFENPSHLEVQGLAAISNAELLFAAGGSADRPGITLCPRGVLSGTHTSVRAAGDEQLRVMLNGHVDLDTWSFLDLAEPSHGPPLVLDGLVLRTTAAASLTRCTVQGSVCCEGGAPLLESNTIQGSVICRRSGAQVIGNSVSSGLNLGGSTHGIYMVECVDAAVSANTVDLCSYGVRALDCARVRITHNALTGQQGQLLSGCGILVDCCEHSDLFENDIDHYQYGIHLLGGADNRLTAYETRRVPEAATIRNCDWGVYVSPRLLFTLDDDGFPADLDRATVSSSLRTAFADREFPLGPAPTVTVVASGQWLLTDDRTDSAGRAVHDAYLLWSPPWTDRIDVRSACTGTVVRNLRLSDNQTGITLRCLGWQSNDLSTRLEQNAVTGGSTGIQVYACHDLQLAGNVVRNAETGMQIRDSSNWRLTDGNDIRSCTAQGLRCSDTWNGLVGDGVFTGNTVGLEADTFEDLRVQRNVFTGHPQWAADFRATEGPNAWGLTFSGNTITGTGPEGESGGLRLALSHPDTDVLHTLATVADNEISSTGQALEIRSGQGHHTVDGNRFTGNASGAACYGGDGPSSLWFRDNVLSGHTATALRVNAVTGFEIGGNRFDGNEQSLQITDCVADSVTRTVTDNLISAGGAPAVAIESSSLSISDNTLSADSGTAVEVSGSSDQTVRLRHSVFSSPVNLAVPEGADAPTIVSSNNWWNDVVCSGDPSDVTADVGPTTDYQPYEHRYGWLGAVPRASFDFAPETPGAGEMVTFHGACEDPDSTTFTCAWDFGDGTTATALTPTHAYAAPGTYTVSFTCTDDTPLPTGETGLADTAVHTLVVPVERVTVTATAPEGGEVRFLTQPLQWTGENGDQAVYETGTSVTVAAFAVGTAEHHFAGWEDGNGKVLATESEWTFTVTGNLDLTAVFAANLYELSTRVEPFSHAGTITRDPPPSEGDSYPHGTSVTVTADPAQHYTFVEWTGDATGAANPVSIAVSRDRSVTATFAPVEYELVLQVNQPERGTAVVRRPKEGAGTYPYGTAVLVEAVPEPGFVFAHWIDSTGSLLSRANPYPFTLESDRVVEAVFDTIAYDLEVTCVPEDTGLYTRNWDTPGVETVTAEPLQGYEFLHWTDPKGSVLSTESAITVDVEDDAEISLTAHFRPRTFLVRLEALPETKVRVQGSLFTVADPAGQEAERLRNGVLSNDLVIEFENRWFDLPQDLTVEADKEGKMPGEGYLLVREQNTPVYRLVVGDEELRVYGVPDPDQEDRFPCPYSHQVTMETYGIAEGYVPDTIEDLVSGWQGTYGADTCTEEPCAIHTFTVHGDSVRRVRYRPKRYFIRVINNYAPYTALEFDPPPAAVFDQDDGLAEGLTVYDGFPHGGTVTIRVRNTTDQARFTGWSGDLQSAANPLSFAIEGDTDLLVNAEFISYTLTVTADPPDWGDAVIVESVKAAYSPGEQVTINASSHDPLLYRFSGWSGTARSTPAWQTIAMDGDKSLTAHFERLRYSLSVGADPDTGGRVLYSPEPGADGRYPAGETVTVTVEAFPGWDYVGIWDNNGIPAHLGEPEFEVVLDANKSGTARFQDAQPPTVDEVTVEARSYAATVSFVTDEPTNAVLFLDTDEDVDTENADAYHGADTIEHRLDVSADNLVPLQPGTTYFGRVRVTDRAGLTAWSEVFSFIPPPDVTPPTVRANGLPANAVFSGGQSADPIRVELQADEHVEFRYATTPGLPFGDMTRVSGNLDTTHDTLVITDCRDGESRSCFVKAQDRAGLVSEHDVVVSVTRSGDTWWAGTDPDAPWDWIAEATGTGVANGAVTLVLPSARPAGRQAGAGFRRPVSVVYSGDEPVSDCQVRVTVDWDEDMEPDFGDLRFRREPDGEPLPFWIESFAEGESATVWVRVPEVTVGESVLWMTYAVPDEPGASSGPETFTFFEDFESGTLDGWSFERSTNGAQSGSVAPGTWDTRLVTDTPLQGGYSARLLSDADTSTSPWNVTAAMTRALTGTGQSLALDVDMRFDDAADGRGGNGVGYVVIRVENEDNTKAITYGFTKQADVGTYPELVVDGDTRIPYTAPFTRDFLATHTLDLTPAYKVTLMSFGDMAEYNPYNDRRRRAVTTIDNVRTRTALDPEPQVTVGEEEAQTVGEGQFVTRPITPDPVTGFTGWGVFSARHRQPEGSRISYELLDGADDSPLMTLTAAEVEAGADVSTELGEVASVRVRARLSTSDEAVLPSVDSLRLTWQSYSPPHADLTLSSAPDPEPVAGKAVVLDGTGSSDPDQDIVAYGWRVEQADGTWGDETGAQVSVTWHEAGTYTVTLTVEDARELIGTVSARVVVRPAPPVAAFTVTPQETVVGADVSFDPMDSMHPGGTITAFSWDFGDGVVMDTETMTVLTHAYSTPGSYRVRLWVADAEGSVGTATRTVRVWAVGEPDNLPDAWEYRYFGHLGGTDQGDPDGDGVSNLDEYELGTDPSGRSWTMPLDFASAGSVQTLTVGLDWQGTPFADPELDEPADPAGEGQARAALVTPDGVELRTDIRGVARTAQWGLVLDAGAEAAAALAWNPLLVPRDGLSLVETDASGTVLADGLNLDMGWASVTTVEVEPGQARQFVLVFGERLFGLALHEGWNLISLPVEPADPSPRAVLGDLPAVHAWHWEPRCEMYVAAQTLEPRHGYWVWMAPDTREAGTRVLVRGEVLDETMVPLSAGWQLLGVQCGPPYPSLHAPPITTPEQALVPGCWRSDAQGYGVETQALEAGRGYWGYARTACTARLEPLPEPMAVTAEQLDEALTVPMLALADLRSETEFGDGHIPSAVSLPLDHLVEPGYQPPFERGARIVVYCQSGLESRAAAERLLDQGYRRVYTLGGGMDAWIGAGFPVE
jgi:PKD repeat protein/rhodanese-related sulfurtransferase/nitrous oxidase accessory protein NosD